MRAVDLQVFFLFSVYAAFLYWGSELISDGSELLLLTPYEKVVGSVVLPVLGAVPDGAIVLFSGMAPADQVQKQLAVGVGTLAGSTIMLLTLVSLCFLQPLVKITLVFCSHGSWPLQRAESIL